MSRHVPLRTCVGCGRQFPKRELIRLVKSPTGEIVPDPSGKLPGRGTYLCPRDTCLASAMKGKILEKKLGVRISDDILNNLLAPGRAQMASENSQEG